MEKRLVILLLCCAGALIAESMPTEEQRRVLELLQQELSNAKANQYPVELAEDNAHVGFPTNTEEQQIQEAEKQQSTNSGVVYTRWGSTQCPKTATLIYFGRAGGAHYTHPGTAANYICLPHNPEYYSSGKPATYPALVYGSEYETWAAHLLILPTIMFHVLCAMPNGMQ